MQGGASSFAFEIIKDGFGNHKPDLGAVAILNQGFTMRVEGLQVLHPHFALEHASGKIAVNLKMVID